MSFGVSRGRTLDVGSHGLTVESLPEWEGRSLHPEAVFGQQDGRRFELEVGSGKGTFLVQQAAVQPDTDFLGIEWSGEFFRYAADRVRRHQLGNVRLLRDDAAEFLKHRCASDVADTVHCYFTDPWPKKRHHKRRFVQEATMEHLHRILKPGGLLHLVTDHDDLWSWYETHASRHRHLFTRTPFDSPESAGEGEVVGTNFERKYRREGRPFHAMTLVRQEYPCAS